MFGLLKSLARRKAPLTFLSSVPETCPDWTTDDAKCLQHFFRTATGKIFLARYHARIANISNTACMGEPAYDGKVYKPSEASGMCHDFNWLIKLSVVPTEQGDNAEAPNDGQENLDNASVALTH